MKKEKGFWTQTSAKKLIGEKCSLGPISSSPMLFQRRGKP